MNSTTRSASPVGNIRVMNFSLALKRTSFQPSFWAPSPETLNSSTILSGSAKGVALPD